MKFLLEVALRRRLERLLIMLRFHTNDSLELTIGQQVCVTVSVDLSVYSIETPQTYALSNGHVLATQKHRAQKHRDVGKCDD